MYLGKIDLVLLSNAADDKRPVAEIPTKELESHLAAFTHFRCWSSSRYYAVAREIQNRATRRWVHDDVFGNTFAPLEGTHD